MSSATNSGGTGAPSTRGAPVAERPRDGAPTAVALDDPARLAALARTRLLLSGPDPAFDRLTTLAKLVLETPLAFVSLVGVDRHTIKSGAGADLQEVPFEHSYCRHAVQADAHLMVPDARKHPFLKDSPSIELYGAIAYAGIPIHASGRPVGTLCVIDHKPRQWSKRDEHNLEALAACVESEVELLLAADDARRREIRLAELLEDRLAALSSVGRDLERSERMLRDEAARSGDAADRESTFCVSVARTTLGQLNATGVAILDGAAESPRVLTTAGLAGPALGVYEDGRVSARIRDAAVRARSLGRNDLIQLDPTENGMAAALAPLISDDGDTRGWICCAWTTKAGIELEVRTFLTTIAGVLGNHLRERGEIEAIREARRTRLRGALERESLHIALQPIFELATSRVVGHEALARFAAAPERGPAEWFAEARSLGLTVEAERAALRAALEVLDSIGPDEYLSVNASPGFVVGGQLLRELPERVRSRLLVELTEHEGVGDYEPLLDAIDDLRAAGVRVAVDDTGAGYASLRHILQLRPDAIKLDRSLVADIPVDSRRRAMAGALVSYARETGVQLIAEGIETAEELSVLQELGVDFGQGFLLGRPRSPGSG